MTYPTDPITVVTHPDPYPYYARLVTEQPIYHDSAIGSWVVSSAEAVTAVLTNAACRVRPVNEPVPSPLIGSQAGDIFGRLVRMRDGEQHQSIKDAVTTTLATLDPAVITVLSRKWAATLIDERRETEIVSHLSIHVIGSLLGIPDDELHQTARWMSAFVRCFSPLSTPAQIEEGKQAAGYLWTMFADRVVQSGGLLDTLAGELRRTGCHDEAVCIANGIGFLFQTHDATAGLIGNTLVALARHDGLREWLTTDPVLLDRIIAEVLRFDPSIQNTRRYVATSTIVAGHQFQAGDSILVVLAAANRDPVAHTNPDTFDPDRDIHQSFTFGTGPHACPGRMPAVTIARAGVEALLELGVVPGEPVGYLPSANARIPLMNWNRRGA